MPTVALKKLINMNNWKSLLKADATEWLLEDSNPSVKYFTLRWLLGKAKNDIEVELASQAIAQFDSVRKILGRQRPEGYWGTDPRPHHGTQGYLLLLMWLGYRGDDGIKKAMDYRIDGCLDEVGAYGIETNMEATNLATTGRGYAPEVSGAILQVQFSAKPRHSEKRPAGDALAVGAHALRLVQNRD